MKLPLLCASALAVLPALLPMQSTPSANGSASESDIAGIYKCEGTRPDGAAYHGTVRIIRNNAIYQVVWDFGDREQYVGFGIVSGNVLAVSVFAGMPGVVAYRIEHNDRGGQLVGQWAVPNAEGQVLAETLTKVGNSAATPPKPPATVPPRGPVLPSRNLRAA